MFVDFELYEVCTLSVGKQLPNTYFFDYLDSEDRDCKLKRNVGTYLPSFMVSWSQKTSQKTWILHECEQSKLANFIEFVCYSFCNKVKPLTLYQEQHGRAYITHFEIFCFYSSAFTTCPSNLFSYKVPQERGQQAMTGSLTINEYFPSSMQLIITGRL